MSTMTTPEAYTMQPADGTAMMIPVADSSEVRVPGDMMIAIIESQFGPIIVPAPGSVLNLPDGAVRVVRVESDHGGLDPETVEMAEFLLGDGKHAFELLVVKVSEPTTDAVVIAGSDPSAIGSEIKIPNGFYVNWLEVQTALNNKWWTRKGA